MLGIRSYKNCVLDSWVGAKEDFFCDLRVDSTNKSDSLSVFKVSSENLSEVQKGFLEFYEGLLGTKKNVRHLCVVVGEGDNSLLNQPIETISWVKALIDESFFQGTKRVTFLSSTIETHDLFQKEIFQTF